MSGSNNLLPQKERTLVNLLQSRNILMNFKPPNKKKEGIHDGDVYNFDKTCFWIRVGHDHWIITKY